MHAKAALATCAHYLPVARAASLVARLTGVNVPAGFVAGVRGKAAARLVAGAEFDPVRFPIRGPAAAELGGHYDEARRWAADWDPSSSRRLS